MKHPGPFCFSANAGAQRNPTTFNVAQGSASHRLPRAAASFRRLRGRLPSVGRLGCSMACRPKLAQRAKAGASCQARTDDLLIVSSRFLWGFPGGWRDFNCTELQGAAGKCVSNGNKGRGIAPCPISINSITWQAVEKPGPPKSDLKLECEHAS